MKTRRYWITAVVLAVGLVSRMGVSQDTSAKLGGVTEAQIEAAAQNPSAIGDLIKDKTEDQSVDILLAVIAKIETLNIPLATQRTRVAALMAETTSVKGQQQGGAIMARVYKEVNPRLLPPVPPMGVAPASLLPTKTPPETPPPPPDPVPKYPKQ